MFPKPHRLPSHWAPKAGPSKGIVGRLKLFKNSDLTYKMFFIQLNSIQFNSIQFNLISVNFLNKANLIHPHPPPPPKKICSEPMPTQKKEGLADSVYPTLFLRQIRCDVFGEGTIQRRVLKRQLVDGSGEGALERTRVKHVSATHTPKKPCRHFHKFPKSFKDNPKAPAFQDKLRRLSIRGQVREPRWCPRCFGFGPV